MERRVAGRVCAGAGNNDSKLKNTIYQNENQYSSHVAVHTAFPQTNKKIGVVTHKKKVAKIVCILFLEVCAMNPNDCSTHLERYFILLHRRNVYKVYRAVIGMLTDVNLQIATLL